MKKKLTIVVQPELVPGERIDHIFVWRSHPRADRRECYMEPTGRPNEWTGWWDPTQLEADSRIYVEVYVVDEERAYYIFGSAYFWLQTMCSGYRCTAPLKNVYLTDHDNFELGSVTVQSERSSNPVANVPPEHSLRLLGASKLFRDECDRIAAMRAMHGVVVPELHRLYYEVFENSTQFPLPVYMFFRMAKNDTHDMSDAVVRYLDSAQRCRGVTSNWLSTQLPGEQPNPLALDVVCDALCCVAYSIPYQPDYAPMEEDGRVEIDAYNDPLQTGRGDCEDFALLILRVVLFMQHRWVPTSRRDVAVQTLLRDYVAAATMRTVNGASADGFGRELSGHMNVTLYPIDWFNRVCKVPIQRNWETSRRNLPTLFLEGTASMWAPLRFETPEVVPRARKEAIKHLLKGRMFHSKAPIDASTDPFNFMRHGGLIFVPDAPPGREQMHLCTKRASNVLYGVSLEDEVSQSSKVRIVAASPPDAQVLRLLERVEHHLPPLVGIRTADIDPPLMRQLRGLPGWRASVEGAPVAHMYISVARAEEDGVSFEFLQDREFTAFAEQLAPRVERVNILLWPKK